MVWWGTEDDIFEHAMLDVYPDCVLVKEHLDEHDEGLVSDCKRLATESVIAVEFEERVVDQDALEALRAMDDLRYLALLDCTLNAASGHEDWIPAQVKWLTLHYTSIDWTRSLLLSRVAHCEWLELVDCGVTDSTLAHIGRLSHLRVLDLACNERITDTGVQYLASLKKLQRLDLSGNPRITDIGLRALGGLSKLKVLRLSHTSVTYRGLRHLSRLRDLECVELFGTDVVDAELVCLKKRLPNTNFVTDLVWLPKEKEEPTSKPKRSARGESKSSKSDE